MPCFSCGKLANVCLTGYDSYPMIGFDFEAMAKIIDLPEEHDIVMGVAVGKALEAARERGGQLPLAEVIRRDRF